MPAPTYHTHDVLNNMFKTLCNRHSEAAYESVGKSYQGRDIWLFKIGNPRGGRVLWDGCLHGWEDMGSEIMYLYAEWLLESGDPKAKEILRTNWTLLIPVVNPDSYTRENRNFTECQYGVDLNRNFKQGWSWVPCNPWPNCYRGNSAASEPETKVMRNVFSRFKPHHYVNTHYGGGPWIGYYHLESASVINPILTRIKELSIQINVTPYNVHSVGSIGYAVGDAHNFGAVAWLFEVEGGPGCYAHTAHPYSMVVNVYFPKCLPVFIALSEACAIEPLPNHGGLIVLLALLACIMLQKKVF